jgi:hypothetical protein
MSFPILLVLDTVYAVFKVRTVMTSHLYSKGTCPYTLLLTGAIRASVSALPGFSFFCTGGRLLSRTVSSAVPSAVRALTVVFGMGTGVAPGRIAARSFGLLDNPTVKHIRFTSSP